MHQPEKTSDRLTFDQAYLAPALLVLGVILRILSLTFSDNCGGDAGTRVSMTAHWLRHPNLQLVFFPYPAGHFWLMAGLALIIPNITLACRSLSLLLGAGSLYLVWRLSRSLYGKGAAILSLAVLAFCSLHLGYSATSSSEVPEVFFVLLGLFSSSCISSKNAGAILGPWLFPESRFPSASQFALRHGLFSQHCSWFSRFFACGCRKPASGGNSGCHLSPSLESPAGFGQPF